MNFNYSKVPRESENYLRKDRERHSRTIFLANRFQNRILILPFHRPKYMADIVRVVCCILSMSQSIEVKENDSFK